MSREPYRKWDYLVSKWEKIAWGSKTEDILLKNLVDDLLIEAEYLFDKLKEEG